MRFQLVATHLEQECRFVGAKKCLSPAYRRSITMGNALCVMTWALGGTWGDTEHEMAVERIRKVRKYFDKLAHIQAATGFACRALKSTFSFPVGLQTAPCPPR